jgi:hypothetical protein
MGATAVVVAAVVATTAPRELVLEGMLVVGLTVAAFDAAALHAANPTAAAMPLRIWRRLGRGAVTVRCRPGRERSPRASSRRVPLRRSP